MFWNYFYCKCRFDKENATFLFLGFAKHILKEITDLKKVFTQSSAGLVTSAHGHNFLLLIKRI
jgi:hypothetical protein